MKRLHAEATDHEYRHDAVNPPPTMQAAQRLSEVSTPLQNRTSENVLLLFARELFGNLLTEVIDNGVQVLKGRNRIIQVCVEHLAGKLNCGFGRTSNALIDGKR